jgi:gliding motility-associated-like protein
LKKNLFLTVAATLGLTAATMAQNVPSYVPTNGLVGWWPFTGNPNDLSVNTNNGTVTGATLTADRYGNPNNAYSFNGTSSNYIDVPHNASFDVSNVTISAWYNAIDYGVNFTSYKRLIVSKREWGGWGNSFEVNIEAPYSGTVNKMQACWTINGVNSFLTFEDGSLLTNTWSHFVYTHDNDSAKIYLNGDLVQSVAISGGLTYNALPVRFGGRPGDGWHPFNGDLDDIGIWNRALSACEIQNLYSSQLNSNVGINAGNDITVCQGDQVTLSGSGGTNYSWSGGINNNTPFVPSTSEDYVLTALSSNGCLGTDNVSVTVNQNSSATINETGLDSVNVNGIWYDQNGQYTQVIPNAAGCDSTITINVNLSFPCPPVTVTESQSDVTCPGQTDGSATVIASGGTTFTYAWSPSGGTSATTTGLTAGTYTCTITNECGNSTTQNFTITEPEAYQLNASVVQPACGNDNGCISFDPTPAGTYFYTWSFPSNWTVDSVCELAPGSYDITITNIDGCAVDTTIMLTDGNSVVVDASPENSTINPGNSIQLNATGGIAYTWSPASGLSCSDCPDPIASPIVSTLYIVTGTDENGCTGTDTVYVTIFPVPVECAEIFVPTVFSPNGDNRNEKLVVCGLAGGCVTEYKFEVFDRWGQSVFISEDITLHWDGQFKDKELNSAVFVYKLYAVKADSTVIETSGNVTLTR